MKNDQNKTWKVYIHTTPNGDVYVGITGMDIEKRWLQSGYKGTALEPYINEYGWENITHQVIYTTPDREEAYQVEEEMRQYYEESGCCINKYRSGLVKAKDKKSYQQQWYEDNKDEHKERCCKRKKEKRQNDPVFREKEKEYSRQYRAKKKFDKELARMVEADLKRIKANNTISLMNEIIQFRQLMKKIS